MDLNFGVTFNRDAVYVMLYTTVMLSKSQIPLHQLVRSWFEAGSKPNSITLSGSNQLRTSSEPASKEIA